MADSGSGNPNNNTSQNLPSSSSKLPSELKNGNPNNTEPNFSAKKLHFPNPPDAANPDPATLREQWRFAIKQYSKWYSHAWGTAILAGLSFFALGWVVKGSNPLPSFKNQDDHDKNSDNKAQT